MVFFVQIILVYTANIHQLRGECVLANPPPHTHMVYDSLEIVLYMYSIVLST